MTIKGTTRKLRGMLDNLTGEDWASFHFKIAIGVFWPLAFSVTENGLADDLGIWFVGFWMTLTLLGTVTSLTGMVMTAQGGMTRLKGFRVELVGLVVFLSGPLAYAAAQAGSMWTDPTTARLAQICLGYGLSAAVIMRIFKVKTAATRALQPGKLCS